MAWLHAFVDVPAVLEPQVSAFWVAVLGWPLGEPLPGHPELTSFTPPVGDAYVHRQVIDGPARFHVDLEVTDVDAEADRLKRLGATPVRRTAEFRGLRSPGGLPFCLIPVVDHRAPAPIEVDGHRTRLVQVCLDLPRDRADAELAFWRSALVGGRWASSDSPEFLGKWHDDAGSPLQLLFQRLDEPSGPVRAHLDLGTDDLAAEVDRVLGLGAVRVRDGDGFTAFRDPAGLDSCVTRNSPDQRDRRWF